MKYTIKKPLYKGGSDKPRNNGMAHQKAAKSKAFTQEESFIIVKPSPQNS